MKYLVVLIFSLLITGIAPAAAEVLVAPDVPALNNYYISVHRPDGSCEMVQVFASSVDEAKQIIKRDRCDSCLLMDRTASMTSGDASMVASATRFCPIR